MATGTDVVVFGWQPMASRTCRGRKHPATPHQPLRHVQTDDGADFRADFEKAHGLRFVALRYFNAAGCDPSGEIGERHDPEPHLIPRLFLAQDGKIDGLDIFGDDYPTPDGTCIRDYVHVNDLAEAHIKAAKYLLAGGASDAFNLGTGHGVSVREIIASAAKVTGKAVPHRVSQRRDGDPAVLVADVAKVRRVLDWTAENSDIMKVLETVWAWHKKDRQ